MADPVRGIIGAYQACRWHRRVSLGPGQRGQLPM
jgi:hypothetical protein